MLLDEFLLTVFATSAHTDENAGFRLIGYFSRYLVLLFINRLKLYQKKNALIFKKRIMNIIFPRNDREDYRILKI